MDLYSPGWTLVFGFTSGNAIVVCMSPSLALTSTLLRYTLARQRDRKRVQHAAWRGGSWTCHA